MKVSIQSIGDMTFVGKSESGHAILIDASVEAGGQNLGPRPTELLLMASAGCSSIDVLSILKKMQQPVHSCEVEVDGTRADDHPRVFTQVEFHYILTAKPGTTLDAAKVTKAIDLSLEKYCSVSITLAKTATITYRYTLRHD